MITDKELRTKLVDLIELMRYDVKNNPLSCREESRIENAIKAIQLLNDMDIMDVYPVCHCIWYLKSLIDPLFELPQPPKSAVDIKSKEIDEIVAKRVEEAIKELSFHSAKVSAESIQSNGPDFSNYLTNAEVAELAGISLNTLRTWKSRTFKKILRNGIHYKQPTKNGVIFWTEAGYQKLIELRDNFYVSNSFKSPKQKVQ